MNHTLFLLKIHGGNLLKYCLEKFAIRFKLAETAKEFETVFNSSKSASPKKAAQKPKPTGISPKPSGKFDCVFGEKTEPSKPADPKPAVDQKPAPVFGTQKSETKAAEGQPFAFGSKPAQNGNAGIFGSKPRFILL